MVDRTYEASRGAQWTRVHALQNTMAHPIHLADPLRRGRAPCQEYDAPRTLFGHNVDHLLRQLLPPFVAMAVGLVCPHSQTCVQQQHASVRPGGQETTAIGRWGECCGKLLLEEFVNVLQRGRRRSGRPDGEAETVSLVHVVVWVLTQDDDFDGIEWSMSRPVIGFAPLSADTSGVSRKL